LLRFAAAFLLIFSLSSCEKTRSLWQYRGADTSNVIAEDFDFSAFFSKILERAKLPKNIYAHIQESIELEPDFIIELFTILQTDPNLWLLVDKEHPLSENYEPENLVELGNGSYRVNRSGLFLRKDAAASLEEMAVAAKADGLTLLASSAYRSYGYQTEVYARNVREMGQEEADRVSARPGNSQHQLGLVVDFGSITDAFAQTAEGRWLAANASRFGWSLSFPEGMEEVTGYRWESWHYRYVGKELAVFIDNYFEGIQQYALQFIHEFKNNTADLNK